MRDGRRIVFTTYDPITEVGAHWRMRVDGSRFERLPSDQFAALAERTIRCGLQQTRHQLMTSRGRLIRTLRLRLGENDAYDGSIVRSADERLIAVSVATETEDGIYVRVFVLRVDGRKPAVAVSRRIAGRFEYAMSWSPRGRWLAIDVSDALDYTAIALVRTDGRRRRLVAADAAGSGAHAWSPDGRRPRIRPSKG